MTREKKNQRFYALAVVLVVLTVLVTIASNTTQTSMEVKALIPVAYLYNTLGPLGLFAQKNVYPVLRKMPWVETVECFGNEEAVKNSTVFMFGSASKGGTYLSLYLAGEISFHCGIPWDMPKLASEQIWPAQPMLLGGFLLMIQLLQV